jgi:hypothetical protein
MHPQRYRMADAEDEEDEGVEGEEREERGGAADGPSAAFSLSPSECVVVTLPSAYPAAAFYHLCLAKSVLITRCKRSCSRAYVALPTLPIALPALGRRSCVSRTSLALLDDILPLEGGQRTLCEVLKKPQIVCHSAAECVNWVCTLPLRAHAVQAAIRLASL